MAGLEKDLFILRVKVVGGIQLDQPPQAFLGFLPDSFQVFDRLVGGIVAFTVHLALNIKLVGHRGPP